MGRRQKLSIILVSKVIQKLMLSKNVNSKKCAPKFDSSMKKKIRQIWIWADMMLSGHNRFLITLPSTVISRSLFKIVLYTPHLHPLYKNGPQTCEDPRAKSPLPCNRDYPPRLACNKHELLKLILEDAKIEKLTLDMQHEDLKKMIQIKKREFKALHQNIEKH